MFVASASRHAVRRSGASRSVTAAAAAASGSACIGSSIRHHSSTILSEGRGATTAAAPTNPSHHHPNNNNEDDEEDEKPLLRRVGNGNQHSHHKRGPPIPSTVGGGPSPSSAQQRSLGAHLPLQRHHRHQPTAVSVTPIAVRSAANPTRIPRPEHSASMHAPLSSSSSSPASAGSANAAADEALVAAIRSFITAGSATAVKQSSQQVLRLMMALQYRVHRALPRVLGDTSTDHRLLLGMGERSDAPSAAPSTETTVWEALFEACAVHHQRHGDYLDRMLYTTTTTTTGGAPNSSSSGSSIGGSARGGSSTAVGGSSQSSSPAISSSSSSSSVESSSSSVAMRVPFLLNVSMKLMRCLRYYRTNQSMTAATLALMLEQQQQQYNSDGGGATLQHMHMGTTASAMNTLTTIDDDAFYSRCCCKVLSLLSAGEVRTTSAAATAMPPSSSSSSLLPQQPSLAWSFLVYDVMQETPSIVVDDDDDEAFDHRRREHHRAAGAAAVSIPIFHFSSNSTNNNNSSRRDANSARSPNPPASSKSLGGGSAPATAAAVFPPLTPSQGACIFMSRLGNPSQQGFTLAPRVVELSGAERGGGAGGGTAATIGEEEGEGHHHHYHQHADLHYYYALRRLDSSSMAAAAPSSASLADRSTVVDERYRQRIGNNSTLSVPRSGAAAAAATANNNQLHQNILRHASSKSGRSSASSSAPPPPPPLLSTAEQQRRAVVLEGLVGTVAAMCLAVAEGEDNNPNNPNSLMTLLCTTAPVTMGTSSSSSASSSSIAEDERKDVADGVVLADDDPSIALTSFAASNAFVATRTLSGPQAALHLLEEVLVRLRLMGLSKRANNSSNISGAVAAPLRGMMGTRSISGLSASATDTNGSGAATASATPTFPPALTVSIIPEEQRFSRLTAAAKSAAEIDSAAAAAAVPSLLPPVHNAYHSNAMPPTVDAFISAYFAPIAAQMASLRRRSEASTSNANDLLTRLIFLLYRTIGSIATPTNSVADCAAGALLAMAMRSLIDNNNNTNTNHHHHNHRGRPSMSGGGGATTGLESAAGAAGIIIGQQPSSTILAAAAAAHAAKQNASSPPTTEAIPSSSGKVPSSAANAPRRLYPADLNAVPATADALRLYSSLKDGVPLYPTRAIVAEALLSAVLEEVCSSGATEAELIRSMAVEQQEEAMALLQIRNRNSGGASGSGSTIGIDGFSSSPSNSSPSFASVRLRTATMRTMYQRKVDSVCNVIQFILRDFVVVRRQQQGEHGEEATVGAHAAALNVIATSILGQLAAIAKVIYAEHNNGSNKEHTDDALAAVEAMLPPLLSLPAWATAASSLLPQSLLGRIEETMLWVYHYHAGHPSPSSLSPNPPVHDAATSGAGGAVLVSAAAVLFSQYLRLRRRSHPSEDRGEASSSSSASNIMSIESQLDVVTRQLLNSDATSVSLCASFAAFGGAVRWLVSKWRGSGSIGSDGAATAPAAAEVPTVAMILAFTKLCIIHSSSSLSSSAMQHQSSSSEEEEGYNGCSAPPSTFPLLLGESGLQPFWPLQQYTQPLLELVEGAMLKGAASSSSSASFAALALNVLTSTVRSAPPPPLFPFPSSSSSLGSESANHHDDASAVGGLLTPPPPPPPLYQFHSLQQRVCRALARQVLLAGGPSGVEAQHSTANNDNALNSNAHQQRDLSWCTVSDIVRGALRLDKNAPEGTTTDATTATAPQQQRVLTVLVELPTIIDFIDRHRRNSAMHNKSRHHRRDVDDDDDDQYRTRRCDGDVDDAASSSSMGRALLDAMSAVATNVTQLHVATHSDGGGARNTVVTIVHFNFTFSAILALPHAVQRVVFGLGGAVDVETSASSCPQENSSGDAPSDGDGGGGERRDANVRRHTIACPIYSSSSSSSPSSSSSSLSSAPPPATAASSSGQHHNHYTERQALVTLAASVIQPEVPYVKGGRAVSGNLSGGSVGSTQSHHHGDGNAVASTASTDEGKDAISAAQQRECVSEGGNNTAATLGPLPSPSATGEESCSASSTSDTTSAAPPLLLMAKHSSSPLLAMIERLVESAARRNIISGIRSAHDNTANTRGGHQQQQIRSLYVWDASLGLSLPPPRVAIPTLTMVMEEEEEEGNRGSSSSSSSSSSGETLKGHVEGCAEEELSSAPHSQQRSPSASDVLLASSKVAPIIVLMAGGGGDGEGAARPRPHRHGGGSQRRRADSADRSVPAAAIAIHSITTGPLPTGPLVRLCAVSNISAGSKGNGIGGQSVTAAAVPSSSSSPVVSPQQRAAAAPAPVSRGATVASLNALRGSAHHSSSNKQRAAASGGLGGSKTFASGGGSSSGSRGAGGVASLMRSSSSATSAASASSQQQQQEEPRRRFNLSEAMGVGNQPQHSSGARRTPSSPSSSPVRRR